MNIFTPNTVIESAKLNQNFEGLADGSDVEDGAISATKLDADAEGHGFLEIGRATLSSNGDTITVSGLPARKHLRVIITTLASGATIPVINFNNDLGSNYARRYSLNNAADTTTTSTTSIYAGAGSIASVTYTEARIVNMAAFEKIVHFFSYGTASAAVSSVGNRVEGGGHWNNTSHQITRIDVSNGAAGDFVTGSEVIVLGRD